MSQPSFNQPVQPLGDTEDYCPTCHAYTGGQSCHECALVPQQGGVTCQACGKVAATDAAHPCRFSKGCRCWYGEKCGPKGAHA